MKSTPRVPSGRTLLAIGHKYNFMKVLGFISDGGGGSTEPGVPYLSRFPDIYSNFSVHPVVCPHLLGRYLNARNKIDNNNGMQQSDIALYKYWVTHSDYFRLATRVSLGMGSEWFQINMRKIN